jgi:hypothetical protein
MHGSRMLAAKTVCIATGAKMVCIATRAMGNAGDRDTFTKFPQPERWAMHAIGMPAPSFKFRSRGHG